VIFAFTAEQLALRDAVAAFTKSNSDEATVRAQGETDRGFDAGVWRSLAEQLDGTGLVVPERYGGSGAGPVELAIVCEQLGRSLYGGPYLSSAVLATTLLVALGDDAANAELLPPLARGERTATVALDEGDGSGDPATLATIATQTSAGWTVSGTKRFVLDGASADSLLIVAEGPRVFVVDAAAAGVTINALPTLDRTRKQADVVLAEAPARLLAGDAGAALRRTLQTAVVMLAAEQAGGARRVLEMAVGYAQQRFQFGRAIGSFQAIKHMCADLLLEVESAHSAAYYAAWALTGETDDADVAEPVALAAAFCSDAYVKAATDNIQIHGGIGFTWDHPAHLYLRRARTDAQLFGNANRFREQYLAAVASRQAS